MNLFAEAKKVLDKDGKVNPLGPYGKMKLTGREVSAYFRRNKITDPQVKKAVEVALDMGGAMDIAGKEIQKFYGREVRNSKEVKSALKYANESVIVGGDQLTEGSENYTMKKGAYTRKVDGKTADQMKRQGWKLVAREGLEEKKVEYAEYKFKNKRDAQKALDYFKSQQLIQLDINDDGLSQGELAIDAGKYDMSKYHKEVLKKFKPKVLTTELKEEVLAEGMSKLLSPAQQTGVLKKWNEPEGSTFANNVYSNAKIANKKDFIVTSHSVKDGDYYLSLLGRAKEGQIDNELVKANTNMNADIRKVCAKWKKVASQHSNPAGMCYLEIERDLCDKKYNKFAASDTMVREVVWGMVEDIMGIKIKTA